MNIVILGHVCIDRNVSEHGSFIGAGSPAMFMQRIYRHFADCKVTIIAPFASDFTPYIGNANVLGYRKDISHTLVYENIMIGSTRTQKCFHYEDAMPLEVTQEFIQPLARADMVCIAPLTSAYTAGYLRAYLQHKKKDTKVFLLPQGYFRSFEPDNSVVQREFIEASDILAHVDGVIVSKEDHMDIESYAKEWSDSFGCDVIVTKASQGATIFETSKKAYDIPTIQVPESQIISSVGAGDIFSAAYMYAYQRSQDIQRSVVFAHTIAGQCLKYAPDAIRIEMPTL